jgi:DNA primase
MIDLQTVTEFMLQYFEQVTISQNGQHFLARCLLCGDSRKNSHKKRFNLNWNNGVPGYHCFNCGESGNFYKIYSLVKGLSYDEAVAELNKWESVQNRLKQDRNKIKAEKKKEEFNFNHILDDCYSLTSSTDSIIGRRYIQELEKFYCNRNVPLNYDIFVAYKGEYKSRFIIPLYNENDNIIYFQGRRIPKTLKYPKYKNPAVPKELIIPNWHRFDLSMPVVIAEGLLDSYMLGTQGTSCLGKEISEDFLYELFKICKERPIVALDNDEEGHKALLRFLKKNKYARKVKYFIYPSDFEKYKDLNNIACGENIQNVYEIVLNNSVDYIQLQYFLKLLEGKYEANENRF